MLSRSVALNFFKPASFKLIGNWHPIIGCIPLSDSTSENSRAPNKFALSAIPTAGILNSQHRFANAFAKIADPSKPWLHPAQVLMTIITDGGDGCGKTTLAVEVILPLLEAYYRPEGVLRRAPSNKPARLIGGRTMHSGQGLTLVLVLAALCLCASHI